MKDIKTYFVVSACVVALKKSTNILFHLLTLLTYYFLQVVFNLGALSLLQRPNSEMQMLVQAGLFVENENNTFTIPQDSPLRKICREQLSGKSYIEWDEFMADVRANKTS
jgi:hypothetical protein